MLPTGVLVLLLVKVYVNSFIVMFGPARVSSVSSHKYNIVFVDDFS